LDSSTSGSRETRESSAHVTAPPPSCILHFNPHQTLACIHLPPGLPPPPVVPSCSLTEKPQENILLQSKFRERQTSFTTTATTSPGCRRSGHPRTLPTASSTPRRPPLPLVTRNRPNMPRINAKVADSLLRPPRSGEYSGRSVRPPTFPTASTRSR
jgi:hypothetical protein